VRTSRCIRAAVHHEAQLLHAAIDPFEPLPVPSYGLTVSEVTTKYGFETVPLGRQMVLNEFQALRKEGLLCRLRRADGTLVRFGRSVLYVDPAVPKYREGEKA
jgi:hypothetical protein